jgi:hypothetical protein
MSTGTKVLPRADSDDEFVPVKWLRVPPVELSRPEPTFGSSLPF